MREWVLAEQSHAFIRQHQWEVAVLPFGATEPHNLHMPYGTDNFEVETVGNRACERAYRAGSVWPAVASTSAAATSSA